MASSKLETLTTLLRAASSIVDDLIVLSDGVLSRVTRVFARMPPEDREPIVEILEREVTLRLMARSADDTLSGFALGPPNPNTRIYARVFAKQQPHESPDMLMLAVMRGIRMMLAMPAGTRAEWDAATLEAFRQLEPAERAAIAGINREMLALLARAEVVTAAARRN
jgi:hypothetical protein